MKANKILTSLLISFICAMQVQALQQESKITITFSDNQEMLVDQQIIDTLQVVSKTIKNMYKSIENKEDKTFALPGMTKKNFEQLLPYFEIITESVVKGAKKSEFNKELILAALNREIKNKQIENPLPTLFSLLNSANYLDIELLVEAFSNAISDILTTNKQVQDKFIKEGPVVGLEADPYLQDKIAKNIFEKNPKIQVNLIEQSRYVIKFSPIDGSAGSLFRSAAFSPDGTKVITVSKLGKVNIWDANSGKLLLELEFGFENMNYLGHTDNVTSAVFSSDGSKIITASQDKTSMIWNANTGALIFTLAGDNGHTLDVTTAEFSPDGSKVVTASKDNTAKIWDANNGTLLFTLAGDNGHTEGINSAAFGPDGSKVVTASNDKSAKIWDANNGALLFTLAGDNGHTGSVFSAVFSPDGSKVVTASQDKTAKVWNTDNGELLITLPGTSAIYSAAFSPDGSELVTTSGDRSVRRWNSVNGKLLITFANNKLAASVAFSPDGTKILTREFIGTANIWNIKNDLAIKDYFENKLQTIGQALFLYLLNQSNDKQALLKNEKLQPIINSFPQEISDALKAMI